MPPAETISICCLSSPCTFLHEGYWNISWLLCPISLLWFLAGKCKVCWSNALDDGVSTATPLVVNGKGWLIVIGSWGARVMLWWCYTIDILLHSYRNHSETGTNTRDIISNNPINRNKSFIEINQMPWSNSSICWSQCATVQYCDLNSWCHVMLLCVMC